MLWGDCGNHRQMDALDAFLNIKLCCMVLGEFD